MENQGEKGDGRFRSGQPVLAGKKREGAEAGQQEKIPPSAGVQEFSKLFIQCVRLLNGTGTHTIESLIYLL